MHGAARALGWEAWRRSRLGLIALGAYIATFLALEQLILGPSHPITLDPPNGLAGFIIAPVSITYFYLVCVVSFGLSGDLAARQSIFPARLFTLPLATRTLVGWPMLWGSCASACLWFATALLARRAGEVDVQLPWVWPALLAATYLAWMQALMWLPYGVRGLRVIIAVLWLVAMDAIVLVALTYKVSEAVMVAILAPQLPLAYLVACFGVARARRGDVPDWGAAFARASHRPNARTPFPTRERAQAWFEWQRHGRVLPAMVAMVVLAELLLLFLPGSDTAPFVFLTLGVVLITPPFLAAFAAAAMSTQTTFMTTRPMSTFALVAGKVTVALWSTLVAWLLVVVLVPVALMLSGTMPVFLERASAFVDAVGALRAAAVVGVLCAALVAATWKRLVQSLCVGLTGRAWIVKATLLMAAAWLVAIGPLASWLGNELAVQSAIWNGLPWILAGLVGVKACLASWVAIRLHQSRLLSDRALLTGAVCWLLTVVALYGLLEWFAASPLVPRYFLGAIAILLVPLARVSAAPLALAWGRHT